MVNRTFRQLGLAFGSQTANITAKVDDVVVYQGPITTLDQPYPELPNASYSVNTELFSWTGNIEDSGAHVISISVDNNATLLLAELTANYNRVQPDVGNVYGTGPNGYRPFDYTQFGNTYINDTLQDVTHGDWPGMWWWQLPPGGNFIENITITPGFIDPSPNPPV